MAANQNLVRGEDQSQILLLHLAFEFGESELGMIRSLEATVQGFEERAAKLESDIKDSQKRAGELETKVGATFEKDERYHFLVKRQAEIEDKLDLTKNQAPSQIETPDNGENCVEIEQQKITQKLEKPASRVKNQSIMAERDSPK